RQARIEAILKRWTRRTSCIAKISSRSEQHKMWRLTDPSWIDQIRDAICQSPLFIADGHHRYEVACAFKKKVKSKEGNFVLAYFSNLLGADLTILPIHRLVRGLDLSFERLQEVLSSLFTFRPFPNGSALFRAMEKKRDGHVFGMYWKGKPFYLLTLKDRKALSEIDRSCRRSKAWRRLDVTILHELVLKKRLHLSEKKLRHQLLYSRDFKRCRQEIRRGNYQVAFFMRPLRMDQIRRIALSKERVPQKSTYFYPKPVTGLVMYRLVENRL
ncbi:DUF1015 domain-containing protein, partial [candidate division TA06 bacterium]|nr:DUF1015 domain-containing protein [candidate division TA06 bacterium]